MNRPPVEDIDIANRQLVGTNGDTIGMMLPKREMTPDEALVHAAWLVVLADTSEGRFDAIRKRIEQT